MAEGATSAAVVLEVYPALATEVNPRPPGHPMYVLVRHGDRACHKNRIHLVRNPRFFK
jgi:hypothetical protein